MLALSTFLRYCILAVFYLLFETFIFFSFVNKTKLELFQTSLFLHVHVLETLLSFCLSKQKKVSLSCENHL